MATDTRPQQRPAPAHLGYEGREPSKAPDWHGLVVWDFLLNGMSTGLFIVMALGELLLPEIFRPLAPFAYPLALVFLLLDLVCLVMDLGKQTRFHHMLRVFKPSSPMSLGTWFLTAYSQPVTLIVLLQVLQLVGLIDPDSETVATVHAVLIAVTIPLAFGSAVYKGVLFSTSAQPGWRDARWLGGYHAFSAILFGVTILLMMSVFAGRDAGFGRLHLAANLFVVLQLFPLAKLMLELVPSMRQHYTPFKFWRTQGAIFGGGVLLPALLMFTAASPAATVVAGFLTLAGGYIMRDAVIKLPHLFHDH